MKSPADRDDERRQRSYVRADVQRGTRQHMTDYGPERIGRSQPKPMPLQHEHCRLRVRCDGVPLAEPMRRYVGLCQDCARYMGGVKPATMSIAEWLETQNAGRSTPSRSEGLGYLMPNESRAVNGQRRR